MTIAIVSDSTCDLPASLAAEYKIAIVPNTIVVEGKGYEDGKDLSREQFYTLLPGLKEQPTTATASAGTYEALYDRLLENDADEVVSVHVAATLSGVLNAAQLGAQRFGPRVQVVDSGTISMGVGFQLLHAVQAAAQGLAASQVAERIRQFQSKLCLIAMLDTLEFIRRSGRVSWAKARLGGLLGLRPFLEIKDGKVNSLGEARTRSKGVDRLRSMLAEIGPLEQLAILHTNAENDAQAFYQSIHQSLKQVNVDVAPLFINVTTVIGTHVGPNALGFVAVQKAS